MAAGKRKFLKVGRKIAAASGNGNIFIVIAGSMTKRCGPPTASTVPAPARGTFTLKTASSSGKPRPPIIRPAARVSPIMSPGAVPVAPPFPGTPTVLSASNIPLIRSSLLELWREALATHGDPVKAWRDIAGNPEKRSRFQRDRGKGGLVRLSWDEAATITAASLVHTIQRYGPDRIFGFTPIPAMSMVAYAAGTRFLSLIGGSAISFYDWYADLPPASPQIWGEQTDVPESADWYESTYMIVWGTNLPMTRTPDAHFFTEARYRGAKVAAVAPDYAEYVKFADTWLPARAGTDAALAMAMTHVIVKEFYIDTAHRLLYRLRQTLYRSAVCGRS